MKPISEKQKRKFFDTLAETLNVTKACRAAGFSTVTAYHLRRTDKVFADRWQYAIEEAANSAEGEAYRRAVFGTDSVVVSSGKIVYTEESARDETGKAIATKRVPLMEKRYSDNLLGKILAAYRRQYRDKLDLNARTTEVEFDPETMSTEELESLVREFAQFVDQRIAGGKGTIASSEGDE